MNFEAGGNFILAAHQETARLIGVALPALTAADFMAVQAGLVGLIVLSLFAAKTNRSGRVAKQDAKVVTISKATRPQLFQSSQSEIAGRAASGDAYTLKVQARMQAKEQLHQRPVIVSSMSNTRDLNVFFNWNGHSWDAFEVLGLPAGARGEQVLSQFRKLKQDRPDAEPFLQAAVDAILKRL